MTDLLDSGAEAPDRPRIDPRIAQRWIDARREEGRHRLQVLAIAGAVVACLGLAFGSLYTPLFRVGHLRISITGGPAGAVSQDGGSAGAVSQDGGSAGAVSQDGGPAGAGQPPSVVQIVARTAGVTTHTQTIDVDGAKVAARLDASPSLGAARVARHWPGTVTISVTVRTPLAVVALPSGFAEVDPTGRVVADVAAAPPGAPVLQGVRSVPPPGGWLSGSAGPTAAPSAPSSRLVDMNAASDGADVPAGPAAALAFLDALPPLLRADVTSITTGGGQGLSLQISPPRMATGTVEVILGDGSQLQSKVAALVTILDEGDLAGVAGLDLSVPSRPATASTVAGLAPGAPTGANGGQGLDGATGAKVESQPMP